MLGVITTILTVILVFICLLMSLVILMQRPKQEGLGAAFGGGIADKMLGSGTTDFLQRATVMMGVAFFILSLTIATLMAYDRDADRKAGVGAVKDAAAANANEGDQEVEGDATPPIEAPALGQAPAIEGEPVPAEGEPAPAVEGEPVPAEGEPAPAVEGEPEAEVAPTEDAEPNAEEPAEAEAETATPEDK